MLMKKFYVDVIFTDDIACYVSADKHEYSGNLNIVVVSATYILKRNIYL